MGTVSRVEEVAEEVNSNENSHDGISNDGVVHNVNATNYRTFMNTLKTLNKADGVGYEEVKHHMAENNISIHKKQVKYYLYRGVRNRELKKLGAGQKKFKIIKKHNGEN